jgi:hypothetical protein
LDTPFHKKIRHTGSKKKDSMLSIDLPVKWFIMFSASAHTIMSNTGILEREWKTKTIMPA